MFEAAALSPTYVRHFLPVVLWAAVSNSLSLSLLIFQMGTMKASSSRGHCED